MVISLALDSKVLEVTEDSKKVQKSHAHFLASGWLDALGVAQKVRFGKTKKKDADDSDKRSGSKKGRSPSAKGGSSLIGFKLKLTIDN
jgi:hypothetical protein